MSGFSLWILFDTDTLICFALYKKFNVFNDYSRQLDLLVTPAIIAVYVFPPSESCKSLVSFDYR